MTRTALRTILARDLASCLREIEMLPDDQVLWRVVPGIINPPGTLALHAAGNLQHFIGAVLGRTGYVRDRPAEFNRRSGTRAEIMEELARAREVVLRAMDGLPDGSLRAPYPELVGGREFVTEDFLIHLSTHLAFHLGQLGYLRRVLTADSTASGAMSNTALGINQQEA